MQELFELVYAELERGDCLNRIAAGLVISGGGSQLKGCAAVAQQVLHTPVRIGEPQGIGSLPEDLRDPRYATAVGLILYGARRQRESEHTAHAQRGDNLPPFLRKIFHWFRTILGSGE